MDIIKIEGQKEAQPQRLVISSPHDAGGPLDSVSSEGEEPSVVAWDSQTSTIVGRHGSGMKQHRRGRHPNLVIGPEQNLHQGMEDRVVWLEAPVLYPEIGQEHTVMSLSQGLTVPENGEETTWQ